MLGDDAGAKKGGKSLLGRLGDVRALLPRKPAA